MIRFNLMLFPEAVERFAPYAMLLGLMGILYGAWLACAQSDIKRLIAYSSISHLGFVMLGIDLDFRRDTLENAAVHIVRFFDLRCIID